MHDHCLLFKADIDILGTANSLANHSVVPTKEVYPWSHGVARSTMKLERSYVENENEGKINWAHNAQTMLVVVNQDEKNEFGEVKGVIKCVASLLSRHPRATKSPPQALRHRPRVH